MGFILIIVARILLLLMWVINPFIVFFKNINKRAFWRFQNKFWFKDAVALDIYGNYSCKDTWNFLFQRNGYKFGVKEETISSALGKNQRDATLTNVGSIMCWILDSLDEDHCKNSIKDGRFIT